MSLAGFCISYCTANILQIHKDITRFIWYQKFKWYLAHSIPQYLHIVWKTLLSSQIFPLLSSPLFMPLKPSVVCPSAMAPLFSICCPNYFLSTQPTENPPLLVPASESSCTIKQPQNGGRDQETSSRVAEAASLSRSCCRVFLLRSFQPPLWPLPPSAPELWEAVSHEALLGSLLGPPRPACLSGGGLVSAPAQPPLSWPQVSCSHPSSPRSRPAS